MPLSSGLRPRRIRRGSAETILEALVQGEAPALEGLLARERSGRKLRIDPVSTAPRPAAPRRDRSALRAEVERRKAARDARDLEILEQRRREDEGQPRVGIEELRKRLGPG